jgi:hypothetical protein
MVRVSALLDAEIGVYIAAALGNTYGHRQPPFQAFSLAKPFSCRKDGLTDLRYVGSFGPLGLLSKNHL